VHFQTTYTRGQTPPPQDACAPSQGRLWRAHHPDGMAWANSRSKKRTQVPGSRSPYLYSPQFVANHTPTPPSLGSPQTSHDTIWKHTSLNSRPTKQPRRRNNLGAQLDLDIPLTCTPHTKTPPPPPPVRAHQQQPPPPPGQTLFPSSRPGMPAILPPPTPLADPEMKPPPVLAPATPGNPPPELTGDNRMMPMMNYPVPTVGRKGQTREPPTRTTFDRENHTPPKRY
jgi:hypothetical protein